MSDGLGGSEGNGGLGGKVALVTGASSGIGAAVTRLLAREGVRVAAGARRAERLNALRDELAAEGAEVLPLALDVSDERACETAVERTAGELGVPDILVNNAGVMLLGPILSGNADDWRRMMDTNVMGLMYLSRAAFRLMAEHGSGDIVQISSVAGRVAGAGSAVYNASKWAVNGFSEALRQEALRHGVRVTVIEPGAVATELGDHIPHERTKTRVREMFGAIRQLTAEDIAAAVRYVVTQPPHVSINELLVRPTDQL